MKSLCAILAVIGLLIFVGCASSPKTTKTTPASGLAIVEYHSPYRILYGTDAEHSLEAQKLKQEGWTVVGHIYGGGIQTIFAPPQK